MCIYYELIVHKYINVITYCPHPFTSYLFTIATKSVLERGFECHEKYLNCLHTYFKNILHIRHCIYLLNHVTCHISGKVCLFCFYFFIFYSCQGCPGQLYTPIIKKSRCYEAVKYLHHVLYYNKYRLGNISVEFIDDLSLLHDGYIILRRFQIRLAAAVVGCTDGVGSGVDSIFERIKRRTFK